METPNQILSLARAKVYFPTITPERLPDVVFQELIDDVMGDVNEKLGVDLSSGEGSEITQTFRWQTIPNRQMRLTIPVDLDEPVTVYEDQPPRLVPPESYIMYGNQMHRNPNYTGYWHYDRVTYVGNAFYPPVSVTYTPRSTVFRTVRQAMLNMLVLRLRHFDFGGDGDQAFNPVKHVRDQDQETDYDTGSATLTDSAAYQDELNNLVNGFKGPRIG